MNLECRNIENSKNLFRLIPPGLPLLGPPLVHEMLTLGLVSLPPVLLLARLVAIPCVLTLSATHQLTRRWRIAPVSRATVATDVRGGCLPGLAVHVLYEVCGPRAKPLERLLEGHLDSLPRE